MEALKVSGNKKAAADQIKALYETFVKSDCTMVEVWHQLLMLTALETHHCRSKPTASLPCALSHKDRLFQACILHTKQCGFPCR